ncbi:hypothetical protein FOL47_004654 [Perkinsus chesapeaki]|uniref:WW domain-containing protein n=1 Tax=Perkinsus chesapeaki TaxID=330153 RepID=A0A7J6M1H8_PERCH|nr:hypothetical protein FOL47_004654 [Perkinsus chesapeaki]
MIRQFLTDGLPVHWKEYTTLVEGKQTSQVFYYNEESGESQWQHPAESELIGKLIGMDDIKALPGGMLWLQQERRRLAESSTKCRPVLQATRNAKVNVDSDPGTSSLLSLSE